MRILRCLAPVGLLFAACSACAGGGLKVDKISGYWSSAQTRLQINAVMVDPLPAPWLVAGAGPAWAAGPMAASVAGDYYFSKDLADDALPHRGFRASSALLIRQPGVSLSEAAWTSRSMASFASPSRVRLGKVDSGAYDAAGQSMSALPYFGIGYSDYSLKSGWGFWADIGLVVQQPSSAMGFGRTLSGSQGVDELVRDLQLAPMLQLGVNYSF